MLAAEQRMHSSADFAVAMRRGRKFADGVLVFHLGIAPDSDKRCGFIVSKAVGGSVVRHRVTRRLRHLCSDLYPSLPDGARLVVRALPGAATAKYVDLRQSACAFSQSPALRQAMR